MKVTSRLLSALCALFAVLAFASSLHAQTANVLSQGIWVDRGGLLALPTSGTAWDNVLNAAKQTCTKPDLSNQDDPANVCVMAKALVFARTGQETYRLNVVDALWAVINAGVYNGRALALGRELGAYVISADLINLKTYDPAMDTTFRGVIRALLTTPTTDGPASVIECHENRPNNWGTHCGASRAAVAAYLGDTAQLARIAQVFKGWLGDRSSYAGFSYGDLSWQCDSSKPVGINPAGCLKSGHSVDGVLPDDQRRAGSFAWPPPQENYVYEALQGALAQAVILSRAGYDTFNWQDRALQRAFQWLLSQDNFPATGDDSWEPHLINYFYASIGYKIAAPVPTQPGKNVGWTDWTHQLGARSTATLSLSPQTLSFSATQGGPSPSAQPVDVANIGSGTLNWTASSSDSTWSVSPSSGTGNGTISVAPNTTGLAAGTYSATITVSASGANGSPASVTASVIVGSTAKVNTVRMSPVSVTGGTSSTGTVTLSAAAPGGGAVIALQSNNGAANLPASVSIPGGAMSATFTANTTSVSTTQTATITASYNGSAQTALTVNPAATQSSGLTVSPLQLTGGGSATGTVSIPSPAGGKGVTFVLKSNNAAVSVPASINIGHNKTSATFALSTTSVSATQVAIVTATGNGSTLTASLTVNPAAGGGGSITPQTLPALADSYVRDGSATTNFGSDTLLEVKDGDPTFDRRGFVKFSLNTLSGTLTSATLRLYVSDLPNGSPAPLCVFAVGADSWTEAGITWSNQPATGAQLACVNVSAIGWVSLDVSAPAIQELAGDKTLSLALEDNTAVNLMVRMNSRENASNKPGLDVR